MERGLVLGGLAACSGADDPPPSPGVGGSAGGSGGSGGAGGSLAGGSGGSGGGGTAATVGGGGGGGASTAGGGGAGGTAAGSGGSAGGSSGGVGGAAGGGGATTGGGGAGGGGGAAGGGGTGGTAPFALTSPAFDHVEACGPQGAAGMCELFPTANIMMSIGGQNQSPELNWGAGPAGTMGYAVCLNDLSFNNPHWCIWAIPGGTSQLPANLARTAMLTMPNGARQESFSGNDNGYMGPGAKGNVYEFTVYALNTASFMPDNPNSHTAVFNELEDDEDDIVLATSRLRGRAAP